MNRACRLRFFLIIFAGISILSCEEKRDISPDLIIHGGNIYTVDHTLPRAEALAVIGDTIAFLGSNEEILELRGPETQIIDAKGAFIMPGFIEGHGHFPGLGASLLDLNFLTSGSWDEVVFAVAEKVRAAKPGEWIIGRGWHQEKWTESPAANVLGYPFHHELSQVSPDNPVLLEHASGHALMANQAAMDKAGVTRETPDPAGGHLVRSGDGEPIGVFEENAQSLIEIAYQEYLTTLSPAQLEERWQKGLALAQQECLRKGITTFHDAGSSLDEIEKIRQRAESGQLDLRLWMMIRHTPEFLEGKLTPYPQIGIANGFFTCRAIKVSVDGALGSYGAWLIEPYSDKPGFTGQNTTRLEEISRLADLCAASGLQFCTHAIGDRANREVLDLYEAKLKEHNLSADARWRIEHAQHLHPDDILRFKTLGVIASMQGIHCTSDAPFVVKRLGESRAETGAYAWRSLLDAGAVVTNGTDAPVEDVDPIASFYATVTRKRADTGLIFYPGQALSRAEAIHSYTMANAYAGFEEDVKGSLTPGKYADIVILSQDIVSCPEEEIMETRVLMTLVGGQVKFRSSDF